MIELLRKDMQLYAKVLMNLRLPIKYENKVFGKNERVELLLQDEVMHILAKNGNILFWNGEKYIKLNLGQYYDIMQRKNYKIVDYVEPKKEEPKPQPKVEPKKEEPKVEEVVKEEPKQQEQPKKEENKQIDNKKQRHNNNNNKQQGGDK